VVSTLEKAIRLSSLNVAVFPFRILADGSKVPCIPKRTGGEGHKDATTDPERIKEFWRRYPDALIGVSAGASGLVCADVDEKNSVSGSRSISDAWLDLPKTWEQETPTGGHHYVYEAPPGVRLAPSANYQGVQGLDIRGGSSWFGFYSEDLPESRDEFSPAPEWLCEPTTERTGESFSGELSEWLDALERGEPDGRVREAIERIPVGDISHSQMVEVQFNFIRLAAEGSVGVDQGLNILHDAWMTRSPEDHSTPPGQWDFKFNEALLSGIQKAGATESAIASLPPYQTALDLAAENGLDTALVFGSPRPKEHYFRLLRALVALPLSDDEIAAVAWSAPTVKSWSREWGIEYLFEQIAVAQNEWLARIAPRENPESHNFPNGNNSDSGTKRTQVTSSDYESFQLISPEERQTLTNFPSFLDEYMDWINATTRFRNEPYHRACAWAILSMAFGNAAFLPISSDDKVPLNLYLVSPGDSSSGKTSSTKPRNAVLRQAFPGDGGYSVGANNVSPQMFHELLIDRDGGSVLFHSDEAAEFFMQLERAGTNNMGPMAGELKNGYDGYIDPVTKRVSKDYLGRSAITAITAHLFATPDRLFSYLDEGQFLDGLLARCLWMWGEPVEINETSFSMRLARGVVADTDSPVAMAMARRLVGIANAQRKFAMVGSHEAEDRLTRAKQDLYERLSAHPRWKLLESPWQRLAISISKATGLLAIADGRLRFELHDALNAISQAEEWVSGLLRAIEMVSSSQFSREVEEIAAFVKAHSEGISETRLYGRYKSYNLKEFNERVGAGVARGLIRVVESSRVPKYMYNDGEGSTE
jgi:hypothetical protein